MEEPRTRYQIGCIAADIALTLVFLAVYVFFTLRPGALIDGELFSPAARGTPSYIPGSSTTPQALSPAPLPRTALSFCWISPRTFPESTRLPSERKAPRGGRPSSPAERTFCGRAITAKTSFSPCGIKTGTTPTGWRFTAPPTTGTSSPRPWTTW